MKTSLLLLVTSLLWAPFLSAQSSPNPDDAKAQIFAGYSSYHPGFSSTISTSSFVQGFSGQAIFDPVHRNAVAVSVSCNQGASLKACASTVGDHIQFPVRRMHPFAELGLGLQYLSPKGYDMEIAPIITAGAGLDIRVAHRIMIRPIQYSYVGGFYSLKTSSGVQSSRSISLNGGRFQAGVIIDVGVAAAEIPPRASCSSDAAEVIAGSKIQIAVQAEGFRQQKLQYTYAGTGLPAIAGGSPVAQVDTAGLATGDYLVSVMIENRRKGQRHRSAQCEVKFAVKTPGASEAEGISNRASGRTSDSAIALAKDDHAVAPWGGGPFGGEVPHPDATKAAEHDASQERNPNPLPASMFGEIEFVRDTKRPSRVDNQAKAVLDRHADALASAPEARGVIVGLVDAAERQATTSNLAAQRAVNAKDYLKRDKGIDPERLQVRTEPGAGKRVELWVVPLGAQLPRQDATVVDEQRVKAVPRSATPTRRAPRQHSKSHANRRTTPAKASD